MAEYKNGLYFPKEDILKVLEGNKDARRLREMLEDKFLDKMYYMEDGYGAKPHIVDFFEYNDQKAQLYVASKISTLLYYAEDPKIILTDVINPLQIPGVRRNVYAKNDEFHQFIGTDGAELFYAKRYLVGIAWKLTEVLCLYFYAK